MALSQTRLLSPLLIKDFTLHNDIQSFQKKIEDIIEWSVLHRAKLFAGILATVAVLTTCSYLWQLINGLGRTSLTGVASIDGQPIRYGTVTIITQDNKILKSHISPDGTYTFPSIKPGKLRVAVSSPNPRSVFEQRNNKDSNAIIDQPTPRQNQLGDVTNSGPTTVAAPNSKSPPKAVLQTAQQKLWRPLPGRYANPRTSGLTITATAAEEIHELRLETPKKLKNGVPTGRNPQD